MKFFWSLKSLNDLGRVNVPNQVLISLKNSYCDNLGTRTYGMQVCGDQNAGCETYFCATFKLELALLILRSIFVVASLDYPSSPVQLEKKQS